MSDPISQFEEVLKSADLKIINYEPTKHRSVKLSSRPACTIENFSNLLKNEHLSKLISRPVIIEAVSDTEKMGKLLRDYAKEKLKSSGSGGAREIPPEWEGYQLNLDPSHPGKDLRFYLTTAKEEMAPTSGSVYMRVMGLKEEEAVSLARQAIPTYLPRSPKGVVVQEVRGEPRSIFNTYPTPEWMSYDGDLPDRLPMLFKKLVRHLFPIKIEREFFFAWLYESLFNRAPTYLILCGVGGSGKNRLKLVMRALHGHENTVDGKKSTLTNQFNSQLADATLAWFDELQYDKNTENVMKEIQNDSISIERKGVDATRSTKVYASIAISNNKPRDNHIAMDARKFVPLVIADKRLDTVMTVEEMDILTRKVEDRYSDHYDMAFVAQIGRWIEKHGQSDKWPGMEYKGPMFYKLAHTSMTTWQKKAVQTLLKGEGLNNSRIVFDEKKGYLWSTVSEAMYKKKGGDRFSSPVEFSSVATFLEGFVADGGKKVFATTRVAGDYLSDFYVRVLERDAELILENNEETYDL